MGGRKVYAVRKGHQTGLFETWAECEAATKGCKGAQFKSFSTRDEAAAWLSQGGVTAAAAATHAPAAGAQQQPYGGGGNGRPASKFYAVARGRSTGIFQGSWLKVKQYVEGYPSALFKAFDSRQEAEQYMRQHTNPADWQETLPAKRQRRGSSSSKSADDAPPPPAFNPGAAPLAAAAGPPPPPPPPAAVVPAAAGGGGSVGSRVQQVSIFFDGGSRGNPGRAGYGYAVFDRATNDKLRMGCRPLPFGSTNNEAEYSGMIAGMRYSLEVLGAQHLVVQGDSELVVKQMKGRYRVNGERLLPLYREAKQLEERCASFEIEHIYREANSLADQLSNLAMDTDLVVDQVARSAAGPGGSARSRRAIVMQLATAAQLDQDQALVAALCTATSFLAAAANMLSRLWDNLPLEEVLSQLQARGWDESIGGPPEREPEAAAAAGGGGAFAGAAAGGAGVVAAAAAAAGAGAGMAAGRAARGQQAVAVAAVSLGPGWGPEIRRQEALMQQQQQGAGGSISGAGGSGLGLQPHMRRLEQQQQQQRGRAVLGTNNSSTGGGGGASSSRRQQQQRCHCSGAGCLGCVGGVSKRAAHNGSPAVQLPVAAAAAAAGQLAGSRIARDPAWAAASSSRRRPGVSLAAAAAGLEDLGSRGSASASRGAVLRVLQRAAPPAVRAAGLAVAGAAAAARMASSNRPGVGGAMSRHGGHLLAA